MSDDPIAEAEQTLDLYQRAMDSMENQFDLKAMNRLSLICSYLSQDNDAHSDWELFDIRWSQLAIQCGKANATLVPQLVTALKAARGFIASTSHSVTGVERQIDAAIAAGEGERE